MYNNESGFHQRLIANASDDTVAVHNIAKDASYHVRLLAFNRAGDGVLSDDVIVGNANLYALMLTVASRLIDPVMLTHRFSARSAVGSA